MTSALKRRVRLYPSVNLQSSKKRLLLLSVFLQSIGVNSVLQMMVRQTKEDGKVLKYFISKDTNFGIDSSSHYMNAKFHSSPDNFISDLFVERTKQTLKFSLYGAERSAHYSIRASLSMLKLRPTFGVLLRFFDVNMSHDKKGLSSLF